MSRFYGSLCIIITTRCRKLRVVEHIVWLDNIYNEEQNNYNTLYKITTRRNLREYVHNGFP